HLEGFGAGPAYTKGQPRLPGHDIQSGWVTRLGTKARPDKSIFSQPQRQRCRMRRCPPKGLKGLFHPDPL
ncbi:MAG: hypothetical protein ACK5SF_01285, partial [Hyphomonadaceae bacterium]